MASTDDRAPKPRPRPLSPHLDVYRFTLTMAMSIVHRITGVGLYVGVLLLAWFLLALSSDAAAFAIFSAFIRSIIGQLILFGFTWALFHHLLGGIRHFDLGRRLRPRSTRCASARQATLIGGLGADRDRLGHRLRRPLRERSDVRQVLLARRSAASAFSAPRGSARSEAWRMRVTALALIPLTLAFVVIMLDAAAQGLQRRARRRSASRLPAILLLLSSWPASITWRSACARSIIDYRPRARRGNGR